jgi:hypothetical protein
MERGDAFRQLMADHLQLLLLWQHRLITRSDPELSRPALNKNYLVFVMRLENKNWV